MPSPINEAAVIHSERREAVLRVTPPAALDTIFAPIRDASPDRSFVVAQLGQSLDGRIATPTGASRWINGSGALDHLHRLRAHVDAVVVGIGTIAADDPLLTVRRVEGRHPVRVVIDPNRRLPAHARCLSSGDARCIVVRTSPGATPDGAEALVLDRHGDDIAPGDIVSALFQMGLKKILVEGGASTVSKFIDAGAVDRLHVLVAPVILGSGINGLSLKPISELTEAYRPVTHVHILDEGDVLFDCDLRRTWKG